MEKYYEQLKYNDPQNTQKHAELESRVFALKKQAEVYKALTEQAIRQSFSDSIQFQPEPGKDGFINQVSNVAVKLAKARAEQQFYMRDEGYAPMTRRGRFLVQVFKESIDGAALPGSTKLLKGFATKKEADAYRKANNLTDQNSKVMDKEMFAQRAELYTPRQLQAVRDKARADFDNLLREYSKSVPDTTPNKTELLAALSDIRNQFRPLDQEIKEVISAKGDKFKERRWMVDGFNELDFIPNIFEYTNYKTVVGQKALTRAEAELQTLRASVQANPAMVNRMHTELDYVLNHTNEMAGLRKMVFYNYLGASVRHMFQNLLQVPLNGVPEMVAQGAGFHAYGHSIKAAKLAALYAKDGTTGNKMFDVMLKQAEKEGVTIPSAIDFFAPESSELQNALDSITAQTSGVKEIGQKASYSGSVLWKNFEKFMRSTAVASETANRRVSFLMSLLESQRKGVTEPRKVFNDANVFTDYVNFVGDKSNRPGFQVKLGQTWAHGPVLLATAMQSFVFNHISQLYAYGKLAMKGDVNAKKAFVTGTAHLLTMAGVLGLPLAQNAEQLFEKVTGISLKEAVRQKLLLGAQELFDVDAAAGSRIADTVLNGFPKMLGIEASASVGLGDPLFHVQADQVPTAYQLAGPVGGVAEKLVQGVDAITANPWDGDSWMKATRTIAPQAINYWLKLADATMKGSYYDRGEAPVVEGLNGSSSVALALGFTPSEVANVRQVQKLRRNINDKLSTEYRTAVDAVAKALLAYQQKQSNENLLEANERFQKFLEKMAGTQDRDVMVKSITERLEELKHPTYLPPTLKESQPFREVLTSYPETKYPFREQLPQLFGELQVAQQLGQDDILARRVSGLKTSLMQKLLYDQLVQAGLEPWQASRISAGGRQASQQMSRTSLPQSQTP